MRIRNGITAAALTAALFGVGCNRGPPPATGISSIRLDAPNPYGEIPYDRTLRVDRYSMDRMKDIHTLQTGDVIATLDVSFTRGSDTETYKIEITRESAEDAQRVANNLGRYSIVRIPPIYDADPRGSRTDGVRVVPTEYGLVYRVPASALKFSDLETYDVKTKQGIKTGSIDNSCVHRPWLPENQRLEKPCIPDEPYKSVCGPEKPQAPAAKPAPRSPPAISPAPPGRPAPRSSTAAPAKKDCDECGMLEQIMKYIKKDQQ